MELYDAIVYRILFNKTDNRIFNGRSKEIM